MKSKILFTALFLALAFCIARNTNAQSIAAGGNHSLKVCSSGSVEATGYNNYGQLGNGTNTDSNVPVQVSGLSDIISVAGGGYHSLALKNDGTLWAWGRNDHGQLGNGTNTDSNVPVQVSSFLTGIISVAGGAGHSLALKNDGTLWAWGWNYWGQLGNGTNTDSNVPVQVSSLTGIISMAGGTDHSLALKNDGTIHAWGLNSVGQLGNGSNDSSNIPVQVSSLTGIISVAGGGWHSLALKNDGTLWAWGSNDYGQLGNGTYTSSNVPVQLSSLTGITAIAGGSHHSLALKNDGTLWAWGAGSYGQLGSGNNPGARNVPVQVSGLSGIISVAGGRLHSLALKNDGTVWAWGNNYSGELGNGGNPPISNVPVLMQGCNALMGIENQELSMQNEVSIFPNPFTASATLVIASGAKQSQPITFTMYDLLGREMKLIEITGNKVEIYRDNLPSGMYFYKVTDTEKVLATGKIIVQ